MVAARARILPFINTDLMRGSSILCIGVGSGGHSLIKTAAASGVGHFTLIDADTVSETNIGTGDFNHQDVGKPKVAVGASSVTRINPDATVKTREQMHFDVSPTDLDRLITDSDLVLQTTDSAEAAFAVNHIAKASGVDVLHIGTHPGTDTYELIGTLKGASGCLRCLARDRGDAFDRGELATTRSWATTRLHADMRNSAAAFVAFGLLHYRAGSDLPIAQWGKAFADLPCWVGRTGVGVLNGAMQLFGDVPADLHFGMRPYRTPLPPGWVCPVCGTRGV